MSENRRSGITHRGDATNRSGTTRRNDLARPRSMTRRGVMQYHDGELDPLAAEQLERRLGWDAPRRRYLDSLETLGDGVRDAVRQATPAFDLTDQIMARVTAQSAITRASSSEPSRSGRALPLGPSSTWRRKIKVALGVGLGSTAALAAGALFWLSVGMPSDSPAEVSAAARTLEPTAADDSARGVAIESVDFGAAGGSIFMVQAGQTSTPVVWLTEPPAVEVGSEPL